MKQLLDHGYLKYIEHWGSDERVIESARMSTGKGFEGWGPKHTDDCNFIKYCGEICNCGLKPGDEKLLRYLYEHKHHTPFEMAGLTIEVQAPIFVFRQWHKHRTQCLASGTSIHFSNPTTGKIYQQTIAELYRKWNAQAPKRQRKKRTLADFNRERISGMRLRMHHNNGVLGYGSVSGIIYSGEKQLYQMRSGDRSIIASADHRFQTPDGWFPLSDLAGKYVYQESWNAGDAPPLVFPSYTDKEIAGEKWKEFADGYEVSNLGRVRSRWGQGARRKSNWFIKKQTVSTSNRAVVNINNQAMQVSRLVAEHFIGNINGQHVLHKDDNPLDNRLENLYIGNNLDNCRDKAANGRQQKLRLEPRKIDRIINYAAGDSYDISVNHQLHNFIANGFVTHNSYNESSARYMPLENLNYMPSVDRILTRDEDNKQAGTVKGSNQIDFEQAEGYRLLLGRLYKHIDDFYVKTLQDGVPKELARIILPVGRYSRMRASANLRNWLAFLTLRTAKDAQWETRQYAQAVASLVQVHFPRTYQLFIEGQS